MAQYVTLARPYALAIFEIAKEQGKDFTKWENILTVLAIAVSQQKLDQLIANPASSKQEQYQVLETLLLSVSALLDDKVKNFIQLLIDYHRLPVLPDILKQYRALVAKEENTLSMQISSAFALDQAQQAKLTAALSQRFQAQVKPTFVVDKALIGGVCVRTDTWVMDSSISAKLATLYHRLNS